MSVSIRKITNKDLSTSIYLDIYHNGRRRKEFLKECKLHKASTPTDRANNKEKIRLAEQIRNKRELELQANEEGIITQSQSKVEINAYFKNYLDQYNKKDKRNVEGVYRKFLEFLNNEGIKITTMKQITESIVEDFAESLKSELKGEGPSSYFARFKKVLKRAVKDKVIIQNPASEVTITRENNITKEILTMPEIQELASTELSNEEVKKAFLFSCFTGLRWVDIKDLQWKHIDLKNNLLTKVQAKTDLKVQVTLNETAVKLLPSKSQKEDLIFKLPSHTGALKLLNTWLKKAGIEKHITWHCARHSFATNLIYFKADVLVVSKLLGHNSLKYTQRYTHIANDLKKEATDNLPTINI